MKIILVRHLETSFSRIHRICGQTDCGLLPNQELIVPTEILTVVRYRLVKIFTSPMQRCLETTIFLQKQIDISDAVIVPELIERDWGPLTGKTKEQVNEIYDMDIGLLRNHHSQIESDMQLNQRINQCLSKILGEKKDINFIVSHQGCLRTIAKIYGIDCKKFEAGEFRVIDI